LSILTGCNPKSHDKTLVFPTGRYVNWTHFELIHIAFKLTDEGLSVDNNYDFESKTFIPRGIEKSSQYPATTAFLKKTIDEYRALSQNIDTTLCARLTPIYVEYKNGMTTDLISFKTVAECKAGADSLPNIVDELWALRQKYAR